MERGTIAQKSCLTRRDFVKISGLLAGSLTIGSWGKGPLALAKDVFPANRITMIVPYKAGGGYDIYLRGMSPYLAKHLKMVSPGAKGGEIQVRNEYASAGRKGYSMIFNGKTDGYTIGAIGSGALVDGIVDGAHEFDFTNLTFLQLANSTLKMIIAPATKNGFNNWNEAVTATKKGTVKMAVGTFGRTSHTAGVITNETLGTNFKLINYPGSAEVANAVMRGEVQVAMVDEEPALGLIEAKEVRVLLTFTNGPEYPGAVTIKDLGHPELAGTLSDLRFVIAPPGLDTESKNIFMEALKKTQADPEFGAWAKKFKFRLLNIYGNDAKSELVRFMKFFEDYAPILRKHFK